MSMDKKFLENVKNGRKSPKVINFVFRGYSYKKLSKWSFIQLSLLVATAEPPVMVKTKKPLDSLVGN